MKKKILFIVAVLALIALLGVVSACDRNKAASEFTVTFAGEGVNISPQTVPAGESAIRPKSPERDGFEFVGWYLGESEYDFSSKVFENITLVAAWREALPTSMTGSGTAEDPYVLWSANDVINFSARVNSPGTEGNENFYKSYFKLGTDIDMSGAGTYNPAGKETKAGEKEIHGFQGVFDGAGKKISNISISRQLRDGKPMVGFFGETYYATIKNLTIENIDVKVEAGANVGTIGAYVGGLVGYATLTTVLGVNVSGKIGLSVFDQNTVFAGGIAGYLAIYDGEGSYIGYTENSHANVTIEGVDFDDETPSNISSAYAGGLYGAVYNYGSAVAIINCSTAGKIVGGKYAGGLIGASVNDWVSIINCTSTANVSVTAADQSSFVGGLAGVLYGDDVIADSFFSGSVTGVRSTNSSVQCYLGALVGNATDDDYEMEYTAGVAVVNCYYRAVLRNYNVLSKYGTELHSAPTFAWAVVALGWASDQWIDIDGRFVPTNVYCAQVNHEVRLTTVDGESKDEIRQVEGIADYPMVGEVAPAKNVDSNIFFDWTFADGVRYRWYMPMVKDIVLTAKRVDVSDIAGTYTGVAIFHDERDAGVLQLKDDGTLIWVQSGTSRGEYRFDGKHIEMTMFSTLGTISGTIVGDEIEFDIDYGMSGTVSYRMGKSNLKFFGEYYSADGDILSFGGNNTVYLNSTKLKNNEGNMLTSDVRGTYEESGNTLTVSGGTMDARFSAMTIALGDDFTLNVNFVGKNGNPDIQGTFAKLGTPDYQGEEFLGKYIVIYLSDASYNEFCYQDHYQLVLRADGTAEYISAYSTTIANYYVFGSVIRLTLETNVCTFEFDEDHGVLHGVLNRGVCRNIVAPKVAMSTPFGSAGVRAYAMDCDYNNVVFVNDSLAYVMKDGVYCPNSIVSGTFEDMTVVTVDGVRYMALNTVYGERFECFNLTSIGDEEGTYVKDSVTFKLDGIGNVLSASNENAGVYFAYANDFVVVLLDDDTMFGFDFAAAKSASGNVTVAMTDGYQGVWFGDYTTKEDVDDGNGGTVRQDVTYYKYYKLYIDGYGHTMLYYFSRDYQEYRPSWGGNWGTYSITATGIHASFNSVQHADLSFYYNKQLCYTRALGYVGEKALYADGYEGSPVPPALPSGVAGKYTGTESGGQAVVFNIATNFTGTYKGVPFIGVFDGEHTLHFTIEGVQHCFDTTSKVLTYGVESVSLVLGGVVTEVIPAAYCGEWSGLVVGYGLPQDGQSATITIGTEGTAVYNGISYSVTYDAFEKTISGTHGTDTIKLTILENGKMDVEIKNGEYSFEDKGGFEKNA